MDPQQTPAPPEPTYDPKTKVSNALTVNQPGERTICEVKRHPIGIIGVYIMTGVLLIALAVIAFVVAPHIFTGSSILMISSLVYLLVAVFSLVFVYISAKVYWGNSWVITTDSLTQIEQDSLFKRQSSQLSLGNLEDVTAEKNGVLPHMFNYGWLRVETAGERGKFIFQFCPNPNYYAQQILAAREAFEQHRSSENPQRTYRDQGSYQQTAGDPGYGAYAPPTNSTQPTTQGSPEDYPGSSDQGVNIND